MVAKSVTIPKDMDVDLMDTDELKDTLKKIIKDLTEAEEEQAFKPLQVPVPSTPGEE